MLPLWTGQVVLSGDFTILAPGMLSAMFMRNLICSLLLAAFVAALGYGLRQISHAVEFSNFMIFGVIGIALMISCGYAFDYWQDRSQR